MDTPESMALALVAAAAKAIVETRTVVQKGALNVKMEARRNSAASSGRHAAQAPSTINYDTTIKATTIEAEIGYDKRGQGNFGAILEYGSGDAKNAPHRDLGRALDSEEPRFEQAITTMATGLLN